MYKPRAPRFGMATPLCDVRRVCGPFPRLPGARESTRNRGNGASFLVARSLRCIRDTTPLRLGLPDRQSRDEHQVWIVGRQIGQAEGMYHGAHERIVRQQPMLGTMLLRDEEMLRRDWHHCHIERDDGGGRYPVLRQLSDQRGMLFEVFDGGARGQAKGANRLQQHQAMGHFGERHHRGAPEDLAGFHTLQKGRTGGGQRRLCEVINENIRIDKEMLAGGHTRQIISRGQSTPPLRPPHG